MAKTPGLFDTFKGLWVRGTVEQCPPDHFTDCLNVSTAVAGVATDDSTTAYHNTPDIVRMALFKPSPPFGGLNVPRIIHLDSSGNLVDLLLNVILYTNPLMKDFGFVNFFGRCYISPSDGKVGLSGESVKVYDGSGVAGFRTAAGDAPTVGLTAVLHTPLGGGILGVGTYLLSYAFETASGFITRPATPFVAIDTFGGSYIDITNLPIGPAGTVARWIIASKAIPFRADLGVPFDVSTAEFYPLFLAFRVGDNTTTGMAYGQTTPYDENLIDDASFLFTRLNPIPAGVGLLDYKGRMISYGEFSDPSIVRVSEIGEPESFSSTSGFFITDPSDSTGVRTAIEFRGTLYAFKSHRGYVTQDNKLDASTWEVINFEKSVGGEAYSIAAVLDAKGSSSEGFIIASQGAIYFFNGTVVEPELSYKIRDLWLRVNKSYFHLVQAANDPINKRLYFLVPLDSSETVSHIITGDYRDGLDPFRIKWTNKEYTNDPRSILIYEDFTNNVPSLVTRIARTNKIITLNVNVPGNDDGTALDCYFELAPTRFSLGLSDFTRIRISGTGPCVLSFTAFGKEKQISVTPAPLTIPSATPGREYAQLMNLTNEQCRLKIRCNNLDEVFKISAIQIEGHHVADERPR